MIFMCYIHHLLIKGTTVIVDITCIVIDSINYASDMPDGINKKINWTTFPIYA